MIKKYKNYIIFGIITVILLGAYFALEFIGGEPADDEIDINNKVTTILDIDEDDISEISIKNKTGEYTFMYGESVFVKGKENIDTDTEKINNLKLELSVLLAENIIRENNENLADYGLEKPQAVLDITEKNGNKISVKIGDKTPLDNGCYAIKDGENIIYILSDNDCKAIMRKLDYYRNTNLFNIVVDNVMTISYEKKDGTKISFSRNKIPENDEPSNFFTIFNMTAPYSWAAENSAVSRILESFVSFSISEYVEDNPSDITKYGFSPYYAKIIIEQEEGQNYTLLIGNSVNSNVYVKLANRPEVYLSDATGFSFLEIEPFAYLQTFAYIKNIDTVKKIVYNHNGVTKAQFDIKKVKQEEYDIIKDGKNVSQSDFKKLYSEIVSMVVAGDISYTPSSNPILTYEFYFNDGTKEIINYYEYDDRKIALSVNGNIQFFINKTEFNARVNAINEIINKF